MKKAPTEPFLGTSVDREEEQGKWRPWRPAVPHALLHALCPGPSLFVVPACAQHPLLICVPGRIFFYVFSNLLLRKKDSQQNHVSCTISKVINHPRWSRPGRVELRAPKTRMDWLSIRIEQDLLALLSTVACSLSAVKHKQNTLFFLLQT